MKIVNDSKHFKRRRILISIIGFIIGYLIGIPVTWLLEQCFFSMLTFMIGLFGSSIALSIAERKMNLATADDVKAMELKENMNPLGITSEKDRKYER